MADVTPQISEKPHVDNVETVHTKTEQVPSTSSNSDRDHNATLTPDDGPEERVSASTIMAIFVSVLPYSRTIENNLNLLREREMRDERSGRRRRR